MTTAADVIAALGLRRLPGEGGYFVETFRGTEIIAPAGAGELAGQRRPLSTAIYYLITPDDFSALHRLRADEIFHFYLGDPCEMTLLDPDGRVERRLLGPDLAAGMTPQVRVPAGVWQGTRLVPGGAFALLGTTMAPGFDPADFELGERQRLLVGWPAAADAIRSLTRA